MKHFQKRVKAFAKVILFFVLIPCPSIHSYALISVVGAAGFILGQGGFNAS